MPEYTDLETWKRTHNLKHTEDNSDANRQKRTGFLNSFPNWEKFRDYCYSQTENKYNQCGNGEGWCMGCAKDGSWKRDKSRGR
ncbi:hypothetical protein A6V39_05695 [Candidatus Mycoplasma haematobovis]|uniref:Uncharacterized protein n=1 Tax=Candidatus Mycoplasma haematobovis TaxID=432608 RepID=A0A1A9QGF0_9MOLU|nr:hypothetical protein [Candidatus Mycoplasma haematobovis]OAL10800.1 hypothetical protein A6V39_05695 [Candidatus Mycoplasma haematobovis]